MKLKLLFAFLIFQINYAQQRTCNMSEKMLQVNSDSKLVKMHAEQKLKFLKELTKIDSQTYKNVSSTLSPNVLIRIPVAVHYPQGNNADRACLVSLAQSQITVLNNDFNATNSDISNWPTASSFYPGVTTGNFDVQFVLATLNHPTGTDPNLVNGQPAVTIGYNYGGGNDSDPVWDGYLNFLVKDIGSGLLGYSPLGGLPVNGDAVVMNTFCFGAGSGCSGFTPSAPFHLGRTVTHELGHFFNLDHTFASSSCFPATANCATEGDLICDTPRLVDESYNCPAAGSVNACNSLKSLTMNFMDYVDDPCMYMFTNGQKQRGVAYINSINSQFNTNVLAINEISKKSFSVYPNPNFGNFTIQFDEVITKYEIEVADIAGRVVYKNVFENNYSFSQTIVLENSSKGIYLVTIKNDHNIFYNKIIIE